MVKVCRKCEERKPIEAFWLNPGTIDRRGSYCKQCDAKLKRERGQERKKAAVIIFGGECSKCGYSRCVNALEFHHMTDKRADLSQLFRNASIKRVMAELQKCILVCANCHREYF